VDSPPGRPADWQHGLVEIDRVESDDPVDALAFLTAHGLGGEPSAQRGDVGVALHLGSRACARLGGVPEGRPSPTTVPDIAAVAYRRGEAQRSNPPAPARVGPWTASWSEAEHRAAVELVRDAIARGEVYQANVVGHRSAPYIGDPRCAADALRGFAGASYGGSLSGEGWLLASASPEQLVRVVGERVTTMPVKGTADDPDVLLASVKDRAEHVMIVDLERNDLARVTRPGTVTVEDLYDLSSWAGIWHASSTVAGTLAAGVTVADILRAVVPGGSVTGAPKHAACRLLADLEPVGRGPSMGALGFVWPGGLDLGLTIRTVAVAEDTVHLWSGGGITWGSDPESEVREASAKAEPVQRALAQVRPSSS
jgi:para-aminobenzoate synthetase component 1